MKIAAYVPIKLNNVRTPGKNIKPLSDGTPLCKLLFRTLALVNNIDEKYCFCSDEAICNYLEPGIDFLKRDKRLDQNEIRCDEIIRAFIDQIAPDIIVLTHVTSPFLSVDTIEQCVKKVKSGEYDSAFTVAPVREFLWKDGKPMNFDAACTPRSQDLPEIYRETNGVFVFTREVFEKTNRRVGVNPYLCPLNFPEIMDVNNPEDFMLVDAVYTNRLKGTS
ncbi:MAG: acylneuraminate cytidylyltransferase family protein [Ruminococcus flavefaciens]|nr:acylneuraminate cytidylyltransferase family protein [Ruminococcus flavefaciens]